MDLDGIEKQLNQVQESVDGLREDMKSYLGSCKELCQTQIIEVRKSSDKAHQRLDKQRDAINDLCNWKNRIIGSVKITAWITTPVVAIISSLVTFGLVKLITWGR